MIDLTNVTSGQMFDWLLFSNKYTNIHIYGMAMDSSLESEINQLHAEICAGLADPNRIMILYVLADGPRNVTEICNLLGMSQPFISRHLKTLRERRMVTPERKGTIIQYSITDKRLVEALDLLRAVLRDGLASRAELAQAIS